MMEAGIIKLLLLNRGTYIDDILVQELSEKYDLYAIKSGNLAFNFMSNDNVVVPVYAKTTKDRTGFMIQKKDDKYFICIDNETIINVSFYAMKSVYKNIILNKYAGDISRIKSDDHFVIVYNHNCKYVALGKKCAFCNIDKFSFRDMHEVIKVAHLYQEKKEISHISITGGTGDGDDKGLIRIIDFIKSLRDEGVTLPISVEFEPVHDITLLRALHLLGVVSIYCNIEFISDDVRIKQMPGKGQNSFTSYVDTWEKCIGIFGKNQVHTNIILISEDDKTMFIPRVKSIIDIGVIPSITVMREPEDNSNNLALPELETQINYFKETVAYLRLKGLNPSKTLAGCAKDGGFSPIKEFYKSNEL